MECLALAGVTGRGDSLPAASTAGVFRSRETFSHPSCCFLVRLERAGRGEDIKRFIKQTADLFGFLAAQLQI